MRIKTPRHVREQTQGKKKKKKKWKRNYTVEELGREANPKDIYEIVYKLPRLYARLLGFLYSSMIFDSSPRWKRRRFTTIDPMDEVTAKVLSV